MLTTAPYIHDAVFINNIYRISRMGDIFITYGYDVELQELITVGTGTIIYEPKIIRGDAYV